MQQKVDVEEVARVKQKGTAVADPLKVATIETLKKELEQVHAQVTGKSTMLPVTVTVPPPPLPPVVLLLVEAPPQ